MQLESQTCGLGFNLWSAGSRKMGFRALNTPTKLSRREILVCRGWRWRQRAGSKWFQRLCNSRHAENAADLPGAFHTLDLRVEIFGLGFQPLLKDLLQVRVFYGFEEIKCLLFRIISPHLVLAIPGLKDAHW